MANQNSGIPAEVVTQALDLTGQLQTLLAPYLHALTPEERHNMLKMKDKTVAFVTKALGYAEASPQFGPAYLNVGELHADVENVNGLTQIEQPVESLQLQLNDTIMMSGSEAYTAALSYYNSVKEAARRNVPGAKAIYDDLKVRFERTKEKTDK